MIKATWTVQVDWDDDGDWSESYENISAYVQDLSFSYGRDYASELRGRSTAGTCSITLLNTDGRFSPFLVTGPYYGEILPGRKVRIASTYNGTTINQWVGYLDAIEPQPSIHGDHRATLKGIGILGHIADRIPAVAMQTFLTTGQAIDLLLDSIGLTGSEMVLDTGQTTMARWWAGSDTGVLQALRDIEDTECGFIRETKDGQIAFEDRLHRTESPHDAVSCSFSDATSASLGYQTITESDPLQSIFNDFEAEVTPFNLMPDQILWIGCDLVGGRGGNPPIVKGGGGITTIVAVYTPTGGQASSISRRSYESAAVDTWTDPVALVDYQANTASDGTGTDITSSISITTTKSADRMEMVITNANATDAYMILLQARGTAITVDHTTIVKDSDATSIANYGKRTYRYPSKFMSDILEVQYYLAHFKATYKDPHPVLTLSMLANASTQSMIEALICDVSDRIYITADNASGLGIAEEFFVEHIAHRINRDGAHTFEIQCSSVAMDAWASSNNTYISKIAATDVGNPSGASNLEILQNSDDATIPAGMMVFQWNRDTINYKSVFAVEVYLSAALPAQGPCKVERDEYPTATVESGTCTVVAKSKVITVTRAAATAAYGRPIVIYTNDANPDSDLDGNVIDAEGTNYLHLSKAFDHSGTFSYCILKCWWRCDGTESTNVWEHTYYLDELAIDSVEDTVWRTKPVAAVTGTWYATLISRNVFGVGTAINE